MTEVSALESLRLENVQELLQSRGPCITILAPPYRPGEKARSTAKLLKSNIQEAARQLGELDLSDTEIADLLAPLHELCKNPELLGGSQWGRAIFRAPDVFRQFQLAEPVQEEVAVAGAFLIRSILTEAHLPPEFYLLKLSKKRIRLLRCTEFRAEPVALPDGFPETFEEALSLDKPDHLLENRSTAGGSADARSRIRFGTGSGRETEPAYLATFYKAVDRGIHELLNGSGAGLVLAGVEGDTALYTSVSAYPKLLDTSIHGHPDSFLNETDLLREAHALVRSTILRHEAAELAQRREKTTPERLSTDLSIILQAAFEGRVGWFCFDRNARLLDRFSAEGYQPWGKEDLHNLAAAQTILHGGQAFALPGTMMPDGESAVAILRF